MGAFNVFGGKEDKSSTTNNTTTNNYSDSSLNAGGDGSLAVGANANVHIENLSEEVAKSAIAAGVNQTDRAFSTVTDIALLTNNTLKGLAEVNARENQDTRNAAELSLKTNAGLVGALQSQTSAALERAQQPEATSIATIMKPVLWVVVAVLALVLLLRKGKK